MGSQQGDRSQAVGRQGTPRAQQMAARSPLGAENQGTGGCGPHMEGGHWDGT